MDSVITNELIFTIKPVVTPVQGTSTGLHYFPNPVHSLLTIDSLSIDDNWENIAIAGINGSQISFQNIAGQTRINLNVAGLPAGMYVVILKRKQGRPAYLKFIKL